MRKKLNCGCISDKGFTLVEVIISIGFLCIVCGIIIQLFIASGELRSKSALREMASVKASNAIEACMISDSPGNVGKDIFNPDFTDYEKTDSGYIIREYFSSDWKEPEKDEMPVFVVKVEIKETDVNPETPVGFNDEKSEASYIVSGLYKIKVTAGYVDTGIGNSVLGEYNTSKHYVYKVSDDD